MQKNMLETKGWVHLQRYVSSTEEAKFMTFKGGRKFLGETSFKQLVRVLTSGNELLVKSVDYVKGVLVHDNISVLQRIIDDHLDVGATKQRQVLSDELTILGNYLKVQYKQHHAPLDHCAGCDSHGVNYGLELPTEELSQREPHYSTMAKGDLEKLVASRKIRAPSGAKSNVTNISRVLDHDDWVGLEKISDESIGEQLQIPKDKESHDMLLANIGKLTKKNMETLASKYNICFPQKFCKKKDCHEALVAALKDRFDNQQGMCTCFCMRGVSGLLLFVGLKEGGNKDRSILSKSKYLTHQFLTFQLQMQLMLVIILLPLLLVIHLLHSLNAVISMTRMNPPNWKMRRGRSQTRTRQQTPKDVMVAITSTGSCLRG